MNEKSGKGKSIIIVVLVLIILIMGGAFYYLFTNKDKIFEKCSCPEKKCSGQTIDNSEKNGSAEESKTSNDDKSTMDAAYSYIPIEGFGTTVILFKTGNCVLCRAMEYSVCKYEIKDNKINMHFEADMNHDDPYTITYDILSNNNIKIANGSSNDELVKMG